MGEPFLNIEAVKGAVKKLESLHPGTHHHVSTIGVQGSDFSWIEGFEVCRRVPHLRRYSASGESPPDPDAERVERLQVWTRFAGDSDLESRPKGGRRS